MRKLALAALTLGLLCWQPAPAKTQPLSQPNAVQDRDDHRHDDHDRDHDRDRDEQYRDHYRDWNYRGHFPRGSYAKTCRDIRMEGGTLHASCQKNDSRFRDTSLKHADTCQGQLINDNGRLRCM